MFGKNEIVGKKYFQVADDKLFITSMFMTLQGEGPLRGEPAFFIRFAKCNLACSFCFVPSTIITMADGTSKRIDEVCKGDEILSWDKDKFVPRKVTKIYKRDTTDDILKITARGRKIWCSSEHPFLTSNRGWVEAKNLSTNDVLVEFGLSSRKKLFNPAFEFHRKSMSPLAREKASERLEALWKDPEFRRNGIQRMKTKNPMSDPAVALKAYQSRENCEKTGLEKGIEKICDGLGISFVGDGKGLTIAHKIPDFVVDGQNKVIEVWASDALWSSERDDEWVKKRRDLFNKHGFEVLFLPLAQSDMKKANKPYIREKVARFINNGAKIRSVKKITPAAHARLFGTRTSKKTVYNLEVEDTHTYIANGLVVHNCDTFFDAGDWLDLEEIESKIESAISSFYKGNVPYWARVEYEWEGVSSFIVDGTGGAEIPWHEGWEMVGGALRKVVKKRQMALVITGGEPMLQENILPFLDRMNKSFLRTQIESNGTQSTAIPIETILVVSPKCAEKNGVATKYLTPREDILERADCLKFVMSADDDSPYNTIPDWAFKWKDRTGKPIYISPMNMYNREPLASKQLRSKKNDITIEERSTVDEVISFWEEGLLDMKANQINHEYAARFCVEHGCILNLQIHLYASLA